MTILFETARLYARKITEADFDAIAEMDANIEIVRYIRPVLDREASYQLTEKRVAYYEIDERLGYWLFCNRETNEIMGDGVMRYYGDGTDIEIGYRFKTEHWGKGYATEICQGLIDFVRETFSPSRIIGVITPENIASQRVLEKCGMTFREEFQRDHETLWRFEINPD